MIVLTRENDTGRSDKEVKGCEERKERRRKIS